MNWIIVCALWASCAGGAGFGLISWSLGLNNICHPDKQGLFSALVCRCLWAGVYVPAEPLSQIFRPYPSYFSLNKQLFLLEERSHLLQSEQKSCCYLSRLYIQKQSSKLNHIYCLFLL